MLGSSESASQHGKGDRTEDVTTDITADSSLNTSINGINLPLTFHQWMLKITGSTEN